MRVNTQNHSNGTNAFISSAVMTQLDNKNGELPHEHFCNIFRAFDQQKSAQRGNTEAPVKSKHNPEDMIKFVSNSLLTPTNSELANQGGNCPSLSPPCYVRAAVTSQQSNGETMRATKAAKLQLACFSFNGFSPDSQQRYSTLETHLQPSSKSNESMLLLCAAAAVDAVPQFAQAANSLATHTLHLG